MPTPDFVLALREKIGHAPLWLPGVTAVIVRDSEVLLVRRADTGAWTPVTGIVDPGEEPAVAAEREALEEADVVVRCETLAWVQTIDMVRYENGDESEYLDLVFRCTWLSGEPAPADGENTDARWFPLDALPPMTPNMLERVTTAVASTGIARFNR
jgi:8-oxo-dGTP pyrophosphatase MutT (NUDIX family)